MRCVHHLATAAFLTTLQSAAAYAAPSELELENLEFVINDHIRTDVQGMYSGSEPVVEFLGLTFWSIDWNVAFTASATLGDPSVYCIPDKDAPETAYNITRVFYPLAEEPPDAPASILQCLAPSVPFGDPPKHIAIRIGYTLGFTFDAMVEVDSADAMIDIPDGTLTATTTIPFEFWAPQLQLTEVELSHEGTVVVSGLGDEVFAGQTAFSFAAGAFLGPLGFIPAMFISTDDVESAAADAINEAISKSLESASKSTTEEVRSGIEGLASSVQSIAAALMTL